jgi:hypothetical protein
MVLKRLLLLFILGTYRILDPTFWNVFSLPLNIVLEQNATLEFVKGMNDSEPIASP